MLKFDGPDPARRVVVMAHGAGAGMDSPFMEAFAQGVAGLGIRVVRFEFPYMRRRRETGKASPPDREPKLLASWLETIAEVRNTLKRGQRLVLAGKSMGGRIASMIAEEARADGLVCLGYPFHPPGKPQKLRIDHLRTIAVPTLIIQGERDVFGNAEQVAEYDLDERIQIRWMADGDHSFKPRQSTGLTQDQNWAEAANAMQEFIRGL